MVAHWLLPFANQRKFEFQQEYINTDFRINDQNLHREIEKGTVVYFHSITVFRNVGYKFSLEQWEDNRLTKKIMAAKADYIPDENKWVLTHGHERLFLKNGKESVSTFDKKDTTLNMLISDFGQPDEVIWNMNYTELNKFIEQEKSKGSTKVPYLLVEKYQRTSNAFSIFILAFIGVSIATRKVRGGTGVHILLAIIIGFMFIFAGRNFLCCGH